MTKAFATYPASVMSLGRNCPKLATKKLVACFFSPLPISSFFFDRPILYSVNIYSATKISNNFKIGFKHNAVPTVIKRKRRHKPCQNGQKRSFKITSSLSLLLLFIVWNSENFDDDLFSLSLYFFFRCSFSISQRLFCILGF